MIIAPAIKTVDGKIYASRNSHSELIILHKESFKNAEQGFITDDLRFVNRKEALIIAKQSNSNLNKLVDTDELYSEDLFLNVKEGCTNAKKEETGDKTTGNSYKS